MANKRIEVSENQLFLPMNLPEQPKEKELLFKPIQRPVWTENKAKLIERYLYLFVLVTKHGTYIDGFAGPQEPNKPEMWAAKLVLDTEPKWMRHFFLYDQDSNKCAMLEELKKCQPSLDSKGRKIVRNVEVRCGDFNEIVNDLLNSNCIRQKEATFCLLDQRTFECKWSTVKALAEYKDNRHNKIELFYFLPNSWQDRALAALKINKNLASEWWGGSDADTLFTMGQNQRRDLLCERFKTELGYKYVTPWAIYEKSKGCGQIMYYMLHATDYDEAPLLMQRAYYHAVVPKDECQQQSFSFMESFTATA